MSTPYIQPNQVTSPRGSWSLIAVLDAGEEGTTSLALGRWEDTPCLAIRWNGSEDRPIGTPQSRGIPTWFILPAGKITKAVVETLPGDKQTLVHTIMGAA